ncbi:MAG: hypothetical protein HY928_16170 [Elusimicrobia bacterium]|nr:hypothetical protein [Elusimicrobiota bacterium]
MRRRNQTPGALLAAGVLFPFLTAAPASAGGASSAASRTEAMGRAARALGPEGAKSGVGASFDGNGAASTPPEAVAAAARGGRRPALTADALPTQAKKRAEPPAPKPPSKSTKRLIAVGAGLAGAANGLFRGGVFGALTGAALGVSACLLAMRGDYGAAVGVSAGGAVGTLIGGPLGGLIGALVGGVIGHFVGKLFR